MGVEIKPVISLWLIWCGLAVPVLRAPAHSLQLLPVPTPLPALHPGPCPPQRRFLSAAQKGEVAFNQHLKFHSDCNVTHRGKNLLKLVLRFTVHLNPKQRTQMFLRAEPLHILGATWLVTQCHVGGDNWRYWVRWRFSAQS